MDLLFGLMWPLLAQGENHNYEGTVHEDNMLEILIVFFVQDDNMAVHVSKWAFDSLVSGAMSSADPSVCQNGTDIIWTGSSNSQQEVRLTLFMHMTKGA